MPLPYVAMALAPRVVPLAVGALVGITLMAVAIGVSTSNGWSSLVTIALVLGAGYIGCRAYKALKPKQNSGVSYSATEPARGLSTNQVQGASNDDAPIYPASIIPR